MLALSGAAGVMIGRAAVGAPWLVGALSRALDEGGPALEPSLNERREAALEHFDWLVGKLGPRNRASPCAKTPGGLCRSGRSRRDASARTGDRRGRGSDPPAARPRL